MEPLEPIDDATLLRMVRYALATGGDRLCFRPGRRPAQEGLGGGRELRHRQLTGCDTSAVADSLLRRVRVSERLRSSGVDAACSLPLLVELPGEALLEARFAPAPGGLEITLDVIRPLPDPFVLEAAEG